MKYPAVLTAAVALSLALAACTATSDDPAPTASGTEDVTIQVFAAASLTDVFGEIEQEFETANPGVNVEFVFGGSSDLAAQINEGAPADVFASANEAQMEAVGEAVPNPELFASNTLTIVVAEGNPLAIDGLEALTREDVTLVVCAPEVPCGAATAKVAEAAGLSLAPVSEEPNVTDVLGKVANDQADAGLVYVTDIARADGVEGVDFEGAAAVVNLYPIGALAESVHGPEAAAFVAYVLGEDGQQILESYGFAPAP